MDNTITRVCGVSGKELQDEDVVVVEQVMEEGSAPYPRVVLKEYHDERYDIITETTYGELKEGAK